jgi:uncharacterized protein (TIGR02246 family)
MVSTAIDVEARLRRLEDLEAIRALRIAYGRCLDAKDFGGIAELFTEDGEIVAPLGVARGRRAIAETLVNRLEEIPAGYHYYSNTTIELDGDRATMWVMFAYVQPDSEAWPKAWLTGHYNDDVVRIDGRWLFERVTITIDIGFAPYARRSEK